MIGQRTDALVFDFDGVLVESAEVKTLAFAAIYRPYGDAAASEAVAYHLQHAGISRYVKFRHLHRALLGIELTDDEAEKLAEQFSRLVLEAVVAAPMVPGAREFLESHAATLPLFVASGTPDAELKTIVSRRGIAHYFRGVHGVPATKGEIIKAVIDAHGYAPHRVLMVGDATADLVGANEAGARFVGRVHASPNPFPPEIPVMPDLTGLTQFL